MDSTDRTNDAAFQAEFTRLYDGCAGWLHGYLLSLLRRPEDADEVLQETAQVLWQKFDQYQPNTEFRAWACRIAYFKAMKHRQRSRRMPTAFSDLFFELVDEEAVVMADRLDARAAALGTCMEKLSPRDQQAIEARYAPQGTVQSVAAALSCSVHSAYRALARIHNLLFRCVDRVLAERSSS